MTVDLSHLQRVVDNSKTMPMSKLFREYRERKFPEIYRDLEAITEEHNANESYYASFKDTASASTKPESSHVVPEQPSSDELRVATKLRDLLDKGKGGGGGDVRCGVAGSAGKTTFDKHNLKLNEKLKSAVAAATAATAARKTAKPESLALC